MVQHMAAALFYDGETCKTKIQHAAHDSLK